jgi:DNA-binding transcriptional LysR family regulator
MQRKVKQGEQSLFDRTKRLTAKGERLHTNVQKAADQRDRKCEQKQHEEEGEGGEDELTHVVC